MSKSQIINAKFGQCILIILMILPIAIPMYLMSIDDSLSLTFLYSPLSLLPLCIAIRFKRAFHYAKIKNNHIYSYGFFGKKLCDINLEKPWFYAITPAFSIAFTTGQAQTVVISNEPFEYVESIERVKATKDHMLSNLLDKYDITKSVYMEYDTAKKNLDLSQGIRIERKLYN